MQYPSTRGRAPVLGFDDVLLAGLAVDGGLYMPDHWPVLSAAQLKSFADKSYQEIAVEVMRPFMTGSAALPVLEQLVADSYAGFDDPAIAPLRQVGDLWMMELFHGPTIAFKDYALQLVGRMFDQVLKARGQHVTIVGATSGDTGSAAIHGCRGRDSMEIFILHPHGRVSDVQRRQMTTVLDKNVHNIAIEGSFDDCQDIVKALFNDQAFREKQHLAAVNSINWARIMAQIVYYVYAASRVGGRVSFAVPTGNFGNVFAGYGARMMGAPIEKFIVATNQNDILHRFFQSGRMEIKGVTPSLSPSMDIQKSSNFERLLYELYQRDGARVAALMGEFDAKKSFAVTPEVLETARRLFDSHVVDDAGTLQAMRAVYEKYGIILDPHTAVGYGAARDYAGPGKMVLLATAHAAKFPAAVKKATGLTPPLPVAMGDLFKAEERYAVLPNDINIVKEFINGC